MVKSCVCLRGGGGGGGREHERSLYFRGVGRVMCARTAWMKNVQECCQMPVKQTCMVHHTMCSALPCMQQVSMSLSQTHSTLFTLYDTHRHTSSQIPLVIQQWCNATRL